MHQNKSIVHAVLYFLSGKQSCSFVCSLKWIFIKMPHKRPCIDLKIKFAKLLDECEKVAKEGQSCEPFTDSAHHMCAIAL